VFFFIIVEYFYQNMIYIYIYIYTIHVEGDKTCSCHGNASSVHNSVGNWVGLGQSGSSPSCFVPNGFGPAKPKDFLVVPCQPEV
jgi:hypothetical protein